MLYLSLGLDYGHELMSEHRKGPHKKTRPIRNPLGYGTPFAKGVVIKTVIKKPKKPNSANRKVISHIETRDDLLQSCNE